MEEGPRPVEPPGTRPGSLLLPVDVLVGVLLAAGELAASVVRCSQPVVRSLASMVFDPPVLPRGLRPRRLLESLAADGAEHRETARCDLARLLDAAVPGVVEQVIRGADVTRFLVQAADLEGVTVHMDLDASAQRLNVSALVHGLDAESRAARAHVDTVVAQVDLDGAAGKAKVGMAVLGLHALRSNGREPRQPAAEQPA